MGVVWRLLCFSSFLILTVVPCFQDWTERWQKSESVTERPRDFRGSSLRHTSLRTTPAVGGPFSTVQSFQWQRLHRWRNPESYLECDERN